MRQKKNFFNKPTPRCYDAIHDSCHSLPKLLRRMVPRSPCPLCKWQPLELLNTHPWLNHRFKWWLFLSSCLITLIVEFCQQSCLSITCFASSYSKSDACKNTRSQFSERLIPKSPKECFKPYFVLKALSL